MTTYLLIIFCLGLALFGLGYFFHGPAVLRIIILSLGILFLLAPILAWIYLLTIFIPL